MNAKSVSMEEHVLIHVLETVTIRNAHVTVNVCLV